MSGISNTFIETDRCANHASQFGMCVDLIPLQRLLQHQQIELIKSFQVSAISEVVGGVGVDGEENVRELLSNFGDERKIFSRLAFQLNTLVSRANFFLHLPGQRLRSLADADRDAASDFVAPAAQQRGQRQSLMLGFDIPKGILDAGLGHFMSTDPQPTVRALRRRWRVPYRSTVAPENR